MDTRKEKGVTLNFNNFPPEAVGDIVKHLGESTTKLYADANITLLKPAGFETTRQYHHWYGGDMVRIELPNGQLIVAAAGDNVAILRRKADNTEMFYCKDKSNHGTLGEELAPYIKSDDELRTLLDDKHPTYQLSMEENNWWECFGMNKDGKFRDLMWALDADFLTEAVAEALNGYTPSLLE